MMLNNIELANSFTKIKLNRWVFCVNTSVSQIPQSPEFNSYQFYRNKAKAGKNRIISQEHFLIGKCIILMFYETFQMNTQVDIKYQSSSFRQTIDFKNDNFQVNIKRLTSMLTILNYVEYLKVENQVRYTPSSSSLLIDFSSVAVFTGNIAPN